MPTCAHLEVQPVHRAGQLAGYRCTVCGQPFDRYGNPEVNGL